MLTFENTDHAIIVYRSDSIIATIEYTQINKYDKSLFQSLSPQETLQLDNYIDSIKFIINKTDLNLDKVLNLNIVTTESMLHKLQNINTILSLYNKSFDMSDVLFRSLLTKYKYFAESLKNEDGTQILSILDSIGFTLPKDIKEFLPQYSRLFYLLTESSHDLKELYNEVHTFTQEIFSKTQQHSLIDYGAYERDRLNIVKRNHSNKHIHKDYIRRMPSFWAVACCITLLARKNIDLTFLSEHEIFYLWCMPMVNNATVDHKHILLLVNDFNKQLKPTVIKQLSKAIKIAN
ncbi:MULTISPECIES: hypothetical protein [Cysteiniphilum]|uniref:Uncharacterized protein n=1 Tax=Cysteiniphilum litorale TaxID=2056700 RepID=A0A8J3E890_9GAMM|nr:MULTISPECIES: hypothetical protein [Cysteiniphilum]GGF92141.1 hypothetical protein GCM10010995_06660 [Cysteiniphilum litorale]